MFSKMELNRVPTHLLLDKAIEYTNIRKYNGKELSDSTIVNKDTFIDIIKTINSCSTNNTHFINENLLSSEAGNLNNENKQINILHTLFRYNYIDENALTDNIISYDGRYVYDLYNENGEWVNPYNTDIVFAMAPSSILSKDLTIQFNIINNLQLRNTTIVNLLFDADDGKGFKPVNPINNSTILIKYNDYGIKNIKLKAILNDGNSLISHSKILIREYQQVQKYDATTESFKIDSIPYLTTLCNNKVMVYYHSTHGDRSIRRPFIIAEGFDPWQLTKYSENDSAPNNLSNKSGYTTYNNIVEYYKDSKIYNNDGYDFVYIDWYDCNANIKENAEYLIKIIEYINQQKALVNSTESNILMGQSMGGLIARYALRKMELENRPHQVTTYISHDSPHLGANVPLGVQYLIHQLISLSNNYNTVKWATNLLTNDKISDAEKDILNTLHSESAKQMLINYVDKQGEIKDTDYNSWQNELNSIGFPQGDQGIGIENIAIVNNGDYYLSNITDCTDSHLFAIYVNASTSFLSSLIEYIVCNKLRLQYLALLFGFNSLAYDMTIPGNSDIKAIAEVDPFIQSSYNKTLSKLKITYTKHIFWIKNWQRTINIFDSDILAPRYGRCYDDYYGSSYNTSNFSLSVDPYDNWAGEFNLNSMIVDRIMFIPTTSALAMGDNLLDYDNKKNYRKYGPIPEIETPFQSYYFVDNNIHISLDHTTFDWIYDQINLKINGPDIVIDTAKYTHTGDIAGLKWKSSNNSIASIDDNGVLTVNNPGIVTIELSTQYDEKHLIRKTKTILAGYPDLHITKEFIMGNGYLLTATFTDKEYENKLNELAEGIDLKYEWTIIDGEGESTILFTETNSINYMIEEDETVSIMVRLKAGEQYLNRTPKSITLDLKTPFEVNYKYVIVTAQNIIYYVKYDDTYDIGVPNEDFSILFRHLALDYNDNITTLVSHYLGKDGNTCYLAYNDEYAKISKILEGTKATGEFKWYFPLFNSDMFNKTIESVLNKYNSETSINGDFELKICNSEKKIVQSTPFAIIYKPFFPREN